MTNNDILKKLRVALMLRDDQIVEILELVDFRITKSELGAFFRISLFVIVCLLVSSFFEFQVSIIFVIPTKEKSPQCDQTTKILP